MRRRETAVAVMFWLALCTAIVATLWLDWFFAGFFFGAVTGVFLTAYAADTEARDA